MQLAPRLPPRCTRRSSAESTQQAGNGPRLVGTILAIAIHVPCAASSQAQRLGSAPAIRLAVATSLRVKVGTDLAIASLGPSAANHAKCVESLRIPSDYDFVIAYAYVGNSLTAGERFVEKLNDYA